MARAILAAGVSSDGFAWQVWRGGASGRLIAEVRPRAGAPVNIAARREERLGEFVTYVLDQIASREVLA